MPLPAGSRLGPYEVLSPLGAGGMGEVYRARDPRIGRDVAIKVITSEGEPGPERLRRFADEARAAGALSHPNVLSVFDVGSDGGAPYVVFELLDGETLRERLAGGALGVRKAVDYALQIAHGLAAAHEKGIVHRDLKPENVFVTKRGHVKILDFGLARLERREHPVETASEGPTLPQRTDAGTVLGTVGYMSPEQVRGRPADPRSDIFSFGAVLYEMLSGRRAFRESSVIETLNAILKADPPELSRTNAEIPPSLERILGRCLEKDPDERFRSAHDLAFALDAVSGVSGSGPPSQAPTPRARIAARPWLVAGAAAAVTVATVAVGLRWRGGPGAVVPRRPPAIQVEKVTFRGDVGGAAISPDGRYLAYWSPEEGRHSLWLRDLVGKDETRLVGAIEAEGTEMIQFAQDGQAIYYSFTPRGSREPVLYRTPLIGGDPRLVHEGWAELAPDGKRLAFARRAKGEKGRLVVADLETGQEKEIDDGWLQAWSQDGTQLAFSREKDGKHAFFVVKADGSGERRVADLPGEPHGAWWRPGAGSIVVSLEDEKGDLRLVDLDPVTGGTKPVGDKVWHQINAVQWLPDESGFVVNEWRRKQGSKIWLVSYPEGKAERLPADTHGYFDLSMTADGRKLAASQIVQRSEILVSSNPERGVFQRIVSGTDVTHSLCWTADGRIAYSSNEGGSYDLYVRDADGSNRRQLTSDPAGDETEPVASPDGRYVVFVSDLSGERRLHRVNRDGTGLERLTSPGSGSEDREPQITPDSRWVIYTHWAGGPTLWKLPIDGGTPLLIRGVRPAPPPEPKEFAFGASAAPDGKRLAFFYFTTDRAAVGMSATDIAISTADGRIVTRLPYDASKLGLVRDGQQTQWSHDGSGIYYPLLREGTWSLWKRPVAAGAPAQITRFEAPEELSDFDWSADGKTLAVSRESTLSDVVLITNFR